MPWQQSPVAQYPKTVPEMVNYQSYVGSSAPITFNGLVKTLILGGGSNMADIQGEFITQRRPTANKTTMLRKNT